MKFISIIVPNFNNEKYLDETLSPFLKLSPQIQQMLEIIVVDDKSTDNSIEVINKYIQENPNMYKLIAKETNGHHGSALNAGMKVATGKWFSFLDADDYLNIEVFDKVIKTLQETPADVFNFGTKIFFDQPMEIKVYQDTAEFWALEVFKHCFVTIWGTFFKREIAKDMTIPEGFSLDDTYSNPYIWEKAKKVDFDHSIKIFSYRLNRPGQSVQGLFEDYRTTLNLHMYFAYKCITEINENYYTRYHVNKMIKTLLIQIGCPFAYFAYEDKLLDYIERNVEKIKPEIDFALIAHNIVKYYTEEISLDFYPEHSKLVDIEKAWNNL